MGRSDAFTLETARLCATLSAIAYRPFERSTSDLADMRADLAFDGHHLLGTLDAGGTQAIVVGCGPAAILAFRGTELDGRDILTDIDARMTRDGAHRGFTRAWGQVEAKTRDLLTDTGVTPGLGGAGRPLIVCGHSLGGALAVLAGLKLAADGVDVAAVYSFGAPRLGRAEVTVWRPTDPPVYRVAAAGDPVPWVPFLAMGYRHAGQLFYIDPAKRIRTSPSSVVQIGHMARWVLLALAEGQTPFKTHRVRRYGELLSPIAAQPASDRR